MKLTPALPNFLQARDAIIQADLVDNGGANRNALWASFAKRRLSVNPSSPDSTQTEEVGEWEFGPPLGLRGIFCGNADPVSGYTWPNVFGINLHGYSAANVGGPYYLTARPYNPAAFTTPRSPVERWFNADFHPSGNATVD